MPEATIHIGDCIEKLRDLPADSVHACVTDPPYGLSFMGRKWDYDVPSMECWKEVLRVLKPGGHLLAFGGSRTYHRMAVNVEDAGFEVRDQIMWIYGSGFPKPFNLDGEWEGWSTQLKPAHEPIILARKPLSSTVAENVQEHGTGALNIDGCRVPTGGEEIRAPQSDPSKRSGTVGTDIGISRASKDQFQAAQRASAERATELGRWPANVLHDGSEEVVSRFPESDGQQGDVRGTEPSELTNHAYGRYAARPAAPSRLDSGSAARFFYCAKASPSERGDYNDHPTVKPLALMQWLVRLVTPPEGIVLDPFTGSGSTGVAALAQGFSFIGCEREEHYARIAEQRIREDAPMFNQVSIAA